jgi:hypothetical protein
MAPPCHNVLSPRAELGIPRRCSGGGGRIKDKYNTRRLPSKRARHKEASHVAVLSGGALVENSLITRLPEDIVART